MDRVCFAGGCLLAGFRPEEGRGCRQGRGAVAGGDSSDRHHAGGGGGGDSAQGGGLAGAVLFPAAHSQGGRRGQCLGLHHRHGHTGRGAGGGGGNSAGADESRCADLHLCRHERGVGRGVDRAGHQAYLDGAGQRDRGGGAGHGDGPGNPRDLERESCVILLGIFPQRGGATGTIRTSRWPSSTRTRR